MKIFIPSVCHTDPLGLETTSQPIMQLKELAVDKVRYEQWLHYLAKENWRESRKRKLGRKRRSQ